MKRIIYLVFLFLTGCVQARVSPLPVRTSLPPSAPMTSAFTFTQECPHLCWLGINPGVTTAEEALALLASSSQIGKDSFEKNEAGIEVEWHTEQMVAHPTSVGIVLENGIVSRIIFSFPATVKMQEFIELMEEPDEISIWKDQTVEANCCISYVVYYLSVRALIFAYAPTIEGNGPNIVDSINILCLNTAPDDPNAPRQVVEHKDLRQPWLGFGHLEEYLLRTIPTPAIPIAP